MPDNRILDKRPVLSLGVFPPKTEAGMAALCGEGGVLEQLYTLCPGWIACTYSAGGSDVGKNLEVLGKIVRDGRTTALTHFTCAGNTRESVRQQLRTYLDRGVGHLLALKGPQQAGRSNAGLNDTSDLVDIVRREFGDSFTIAVAGTPEGGPEGRSLAEEIESLKRKRDCGADQILARVCWNLDTFQRWLEAIRAADIWLPVSASVMPVLDQADTISMALSRNNSPVPRELSELICQNWIYPNPFVRDPFDADAERKKASFKAAGMDYTIRQIDAYRACGVSGIHLHTQNRFEEVARIAADAGLAN